MWFSLPPDVFFSLSFALMVASLLATLFVTNLYYNSTQFGVVPHWLRTLMLNYAAVIVCLPQKKRSNRITVSLPEYTKGTMLTPLWRTRLPFKQAYSKNQLLAWLTCVGGVPGSHLFPSCVAVVCADPTPTIISSKDLQSISELPSVRPQDDSLLSELKKLAKDLAAIRLQMDSHFHESKSSQEWKMISAVIDRLVFGLYIVFICVSTITILIIWHSSQDSSL